MKNKAEVFLKQDAVVTWYKVQLPSTHKDRYKVRLIEYKTKPFTNFDVYLDCESEVRIWNKEIVDLVKEAINTI